MDFPAAREHSSVEAGTDAELAADAVPFIEGEAAPRPSALQLVWRPALGLGVALAGAAAAVAAVRAGPPQYAGAGPAAVAIGAATSLAEESAACAAPEGSCLACKCCAAGGEKGYRCYKKNDFWAACLESCEPGVHKGEKHGTYDQYGKFHLDKWSCKAVGNRSDPGCMAYEKKAGCPTDRCVWKNDKCQEGCWTFGAPDACSAVDRCAWDGSSCKDACWTHFSEEKCAAHAKCMWNGKCLPACSTFPSKEACPHESGCIWDQPVAAKPATCVLDPCSAPGEDCSSSKCCSADRGAAGMTCFKKDKSWASCMATCDGEGSNKGWDCKALGNRTLIPTGCAWAGKSCAKEGLCCNIGFNCLVKDETFIGCVQTVQKSTWFAKKLPVPAGWNGKFVGAGRTEYQVPAAAEGEAVAGTSLYCFMAFLPDSAEVQLMEVAKHNKASVFACDGSDVFHSWKSTKGAWDTGEATLTNTDVFINVWDQVRKAGRYASFDWTVKVDADALLLPDRLKSHLAALRPPANRAIYIKNNGMDKGLGNNGFLGAVEVFSKVATQTYFDNAEGCHSTLGINAGEDGFFKSCMDALGVGFMTDAQLFNPDFSPGICNNQQRAAFHPLKQPVNWQCCLDIVNGKPHNVVYGNCNLGYDLDFLK